MAVPVWKFLNAAHTHTWHPNTKINKCTSERKRRKDAVCGDWKQRCRSVERRCAAAEPARYGFPCSLTCPTRDTRGAQCLTTAAESGAVRTEERTNGRTDRWLASPCGSSVVRFWEIVRSQRKNRVGRPELPTGERPVFIFSFWIESIISRVQ